MRTLRARPRFATLSRCKPCLQAQAEEDLQARDAVRISAMARATAKAIETGATKCCRTCKAEKPFVDFARHKQAKDGRRRDCRACVEAGVTKRAASPSSAAKEADKTQRARPESRQTNRRCVREWKARNRPATNAFRAVQRAMRKGTIAKPKRCQARGCKFEGELQAHHHDYLSSLVVVFLCPKHHRRLHAGEHVKLISGLPPELASIPPQLVAAE